MTTTATTVSRTRTSGRIGAESAESRRTREDRVGARGWWSLAVLMVPVLLISIDNTVLSFALPSISIELTPTANVLLWITDVYPLVLAGLLVAMGSLGDRIGRRRLLLIGTVGFAVVSAAAAFAPSAPWLVVARAALGVFGAMLMPATLSLIRTIFADPRQRTLAVAVWAAGFSVGMSLGPVLGGLVLQSFSWRAVFLIALPMLAPMLAAPFLLPESRNPHPGPVDAAGVALSLLTLVPIVYGIKTLAHGELALGGTALGFGVLSGVAFVARQRHAAHPLLDLELFTIRPFTASITANVVTSFTMVGFTFFAAQQLQLVLGYQPFQAGLLLVPAALTAILAGLAAVPLVKRLPRRRALVLGLVVVAAGFAVLVVSPAPIGASSIVAASVVLGLGLGLSETVANDVIVAVVPADRAGAASGVSETAYELGTVLGFAVLGTVISAVYRTGVQLPAGLGGAQAQDARETLGGAVRVAQSLSTGDAEALRVSAAAAFDSGVGVAALVATVVMGVAAALIAHLLRPVRDVEPTSLSDILNVS